MKRWMFSAALMAVLLPLPAVQAQGASHYVYLSDKRIVVLELVDPSSVILNYFNLDDVIVFLRAPSLALRDVEGGEYVGHVIEVEDPPDDGQRFQVSRLLHAHQYVGLTIFGNFDLRTPPRGAFFRVGSRILELEAVTEDEFETIASRIGELDLNAENSKAMIQFAGFRRGYGELHRIGTESGDELALLFPDTELLPPVLIASPKPRLPEAEKAHADPVVVQLSAAVGRSGNFYKIEVKNGLSAQLDQIAIDVVRNSWRMLPAISHGKVADSTTVLNVVFQR